MVSCEDKRCIEDLYMKYSDSGDETSTETKIENYRAHPNKRIMYSCINY